MNAPLELYLDAKSFLQWVQGREGRYELERGRVVQQMTGGSKPHARLVSNFIGAIRARLDLEIWSVTASDLAVRIGDSTRYPDVVVDRLDPPGDPLLAEQPALLVEVLSPSSAVTDLRAKGRRVYEPRLARGVRRRQPGCADRLDLAAPAGSRSGIPTGTRRDQRTQRCRDGRPPRLDAAPRRALSRHRTPVGDP